MRSTLGVLVALSVFALTACGDPTAARNEKAMAALGDWFAAAANGQRDEDLCHGLGTLKHQDASCTDMLDHAARIEPTSRNLERISDLDCFASVCGDFVQVELAGADRDGNPATEQALLKQDEGRFRLYWYRTDSLLDEMRAAMPDPAEEDRDPIQIAYDQITERYPALYQYPPCYGVRASSTNLRHELMRKDNIDVPTIERIAAQCGETFCFGLVGEKIAALCPE